MKKNYEEKSNITTTIFSLVIRPLNMLFLENFNNAVLLLLFFYSLHQGNKPLL